MTISLKPYLPANKDHHGIMDFDPFVLFDGEERIREYIGLSCSHLAQSAVPSQVHSTFHFNSLAWHVHGDRSVLINS